MNANMTAHIIDANGAKIPAIGLGTWELRGPTCARIVERALALGYRHLDTADMYGNEEEVGEGLRASKVPRDDVFITTKVWSSNLHAADFARSVEGSLKKLNLSAVDLVLIHWPNPAIPLKETIGALCKAKRDGLTRRIGISNFTVALIDEAVKLSSEPIVTNQIEMHIYLDQSKIVAACRRHGLAVTAYCPIARGRAPGDAVLARIGKVHGKSAAQVSLRYLVQQGIIVIPRTSKPERLAENFAVFDFALSDKEMADIAELANPRGRVVNVAHAPAWD